MKTAGVYAYMPIHLGFFYDHAGPAVNEIMQLIERDEIKGEEAASLIAVLPKTIREPTEELQRRFLVSSLSQQQQSQD